MTKNLAWEQKAQPFSVLLSRAKVIVSIFTLSIVLTQGDRARLFWVEEVVSISTFFRFTKFCHEKIGATFLWSLSIFYSNMLKNSSQTIFLAHYYHINLENTPQLNFRIMLFKRTVSIFKNFWTLSADHFPLPAVIFHC